MSAVGAENLTTYPLVVSPRRTHMLLTAREPTGAAKCPRVNVLKCQRCCRTDRRVSPGKALHSNPLHSTLVRLKYEDIAARSVARIVAPFSGARPIPPAMERQTGQDDSSEIQSSVTLGILDGQVATSSCPRTDTRFCSQSISIRSLARVDMQRYRARPPRNAGISASTRQIDVWPFETHIMDVDGCAIAVTDVGAGPSLLFVHTGMWSFI
jgi:hypothetical protein